MVLIRCLGFTKGREMSQEGVIKFQLEYQKSGPVLAATICELNAWRKILHRLGLIGRDPARYQGCGFGNISQRIGPFGVPGEARRFIISGTQTGGLAELTGEHYTIVQRCQAERNRVIAEGPIAPSSEALTHGTVYGLDDSLRFVMHVHSPEIWNNAEKLAIPVTRSEVSYGTPEMAKEVCRLLNDADNWEKRIFAMGGHRDGIVSFGESAEEAGGILIRCLAVAFQMPG